MTVSGTVDTAAHDVLVIGGGIAGASLAYELADEHDVVLLEMESTLGMHSTGRSAAMFLETYGGPQTRVLTVGSRGFLSQPPPGFSTRLMTRRPLLQVARPGRESAILELAGQVREMVPSAEIMDPDRIRTVCPILRPGTVAMGLYEPDAHELDVHALHQGYVKGLRQRGGTILRNHRVVGLRRHDGHWNVETLEGARHRADVVVNAAGAWADEVAELAGVQPLGVQPLRRTAFMLSAEDIQDSTDLPLLYDVDETFYLKPEGMDLLASPADKELSLPGDARADELEIARALDRIREMTVLDARSVRASWGGLRTFSPDGELVIGFDGAVDDFFWLAGQGGYGIQTAPSAAALARSLITHDRAPDDLLALGLDTEALSPCRFAPATFTRTRRRPRPARPRGSRE